MEPEDRKIRSPLPMTQPEANEDGLSGTPMAAPGRDNERLGGSEVAPPAPGEGRTVLPPKWPGGPEMGIGHCSKGEGMMVEDDDGYAVAHGHATERFRIPGDALEMMRYRLEQAEKTAKDYADLYMDRCEKLSEAQARIQELEEEVEKQHALFDKWHTKAAELEQEVERLDNLSDDLCLAAVKLSKEVERLREREVELIGEKNGLFLSNSVLGQEAERWKQEKHESDLRAINFETDRDNWRAKAEG